MKQVFGYGSLINASSLLKTAQGATDIRPAYVKGFRREFNLLDDISGWSDGKLAGVPYCALDISKVSNPDSKVNGVIFLVDEQGLINLQDREYGYRLVETTVYDFKTNGDLGTCLLFSACKNDGKYDHQSPSQIKYLELCVDGTKQYGEDFYQMFLETTYIGNKRLSELPELYQSSHS